jgi:hypothetical protein
VVGSDFLATMITANKTCCDDFPAGSRKLEEEKARKAAEAEEAYRRESARREAERQVVRVYGI